ncbi:conserved unknown protein [Ectocarpus siliculosus]|uniref:Uncharacterized protein n=1 Tax=Ectocarpus siliculosus TaxID=2880 RepID=D7G2G6_ECTSI|nr:conserved unknown protein [Ectocarpus siliculosus]|eukprot:CBJ33400.1 conserved unknown protein [Ectocarpus siliculosus]
MQQDHGDLKEEEEPGEDFDNPLAGADGFTKKRKKKPAGKPVVIRKRAPVETPDPTWDGQPSSLLVRELKGHTAQVTGVAFSNDGRFVATASEDRTVRITYLDTIKDSSPRYIRVGIELDHVTALAFSDNSKRLVCATAKSKEICFYTIPTEKESKAGGGKVELLKSFPSGHEEPVTKILLLDVDKWMVIVTCACGSTETGIRFLNPRGDCLATLDTNQRTNYTMEASADNRFLAVGAGLPEVKVLEVSRNKDGEFSQVARAMTLSGVHTKGVHGVSFNPESTKVVTASIDGTWALWDTSVRYNLDEDPRKMEQHACKDAMNSKYSAAALGGEDAKVVALSSGRHIFFFAVGEGSGKQVESVGAAHGSSGTSILSMLASKDGKLLATTAAGDSRARLWRFPRSSGDASNSSG